MITKKSYSSLFLVFFGVIFWEKIASCSSSFQSTAAPLVEIKQSEIYRDNIHVDIDIWNPTSVDIKNILLNLICTNNIDNNVNYHILLYKIENSEFSKKFEKDNTIHLKKKIAKGFSFKEKKNITFQINIDNKDNIQRCDFVGVRGYS